MLLQHLLNHGFTISNTEPTLYVRGDQISFNFYTTLRHPNDKGTKSNRQSPQYKVINWNIGDSKGRKIGLEEAGWIGIKKSGAQL